MNSDSIEGGDGAGDVKSPCIGLCMMNDALGHCLGCGRTRREIGQWPILDADQRREVIRLAGERSGLTALKPDTPPKA